MASTERSPAGKPRLDPALRNAIRFTLSAREYRALHTYLSKRGATRSLAQQGPEPDRVDASVQGFDDFNAAAVRSAVRTFGALLAGLRAYDVLLDLTVRRGQIKPTASKPRISPNARLSFSVGTLVLLHRILHRFFTRMRGNLLTKDAAPFRRRNPRISRALTSRLAPAIGASLAGFTLCAYPSDQFRLTVAIYAVSRAAEFVYNALEDEGYFEDTPWLTSALLMPPVLGQLLHAFLFDRDCFPAPFGNFILRFSNTYVQPRPAHVPDSVPWPDVYKIVDCLAEASRLKYPPYISPILYPKAENGLPPSLGSVGSIVATAHPAITQLTCAITHPSDPSCLRTHVQYWLNAFPRLVRLFAIIFGALSVLRLKAFRAAPISALNALAKRILKTSAFVTGSVGMGWGTICAFQAFLPRTVLPTQRWFWGGFTGGLWALLLKDEGRSQFLYWYVLYQLFRVVADTPSARQSLDSTWKVGKKHGWWRGITNGDVMLVCASLAVASAVYDRNPEALRSRMLSRALLFLRGAEAPPPAAPAEEKAEAVARDVRVDLTETVRDETIAAE